MQKIIDRFETKVGDMQRQIEALTLTHDAQREHNERLNNELTDLTDLHQLEIVSVRTDLKKLEDKLVYNFNDYWNEMVEKLDKLDTRVRFQHVAAAENARSISRRPKSNRRKSTLSKPKRTPIGSSASL